MAALFRIWLGHGLPPEAFWALTPRGLALAVYEASRRRAVEQITVAWWTAALSRQERLPELHSLMPHPPLSPQEAAAEMQAAMAAYREVAATRGQIRTWAEWQT